MKILVTSDTHGMYNGVVDYLLENNDIDLILHAGDNTSDALDIQNESGVDCIAVKGNNDYYDYVNNEFEVLQIKNYRILLIHGHKEKIYYGFDGLLKKAREYDCNIVIFGHSHVYLNTRVSDILFLNPGSPSLARDDDYGFLIMYIDENLEIERINL